MRFGQHFNDTVFRGPDDEGAGGGGEEITEINDGAEGEGTDGDEDGGDEPLTVREQIKRSIAEVNEDDKQPKPKKANKAFGDRADPDGRAAAHAANGTPPVDPNAPPTPASTTPAPEALSKEAKAEWDKTPPVVQAAFIKREQDMAAGVQALQQRYNLIDQAIAPHTDALRQMNATPADAVHRMFLWFKALAGKPTDAFPALAQSMGVDWKQLIAAGQQQVDPNATPPEGQPNGGAPAIPAEVQQYVGRLEGELQKMQQYVQGLGGQLGGIQQNFNQQSEMKTRENLSIWAKDKPYYEELRQDMAKMIESGIVPLKEDGQVDLDTAYERAMYFNPEVRAKVLAAQQQADTTAQQQQTTQVTTARQAQAGKARKAAVSLPVSNAPGASGARSMVTSKKPSQKMSVRDSLKAAMAELRDQ